MAAAIERQIADALKRFNASAIAKSEKTLDSFAVSVKSELQRELSHPGTGKPRRIGNFRKRLMVAGPLLRTRKRNGFVLLQRSRKDSAKNFHRPSVRGRPPAPDTNTLKRSVFAERNGKLQRIVGVATAYARALEEKLDRPFMLPALRRALARLNLS